MPTALTGVWGQAVLSSSPTGVELVGHAGAGDSLTFGAASGHGGGTEGGATAGQCGDAGGRVSRG